MKSELYGRRAKGSGFDVVLHEGISAHGLVVCTEPRQKDDEQ
jgi:hypothetical protein